MSSHEKWEKFSMTEPGKKRAGEVGRELPCVVLGTLRKS